MTQHENESTPSRTARWFKSLMTYTADKCREPARAWVAAQQQTYGAITSDEIATRAIFQDSLLAGTVGSFSGMVNMVPVVGTALGMLTSTPETLYITYRRLKVIVFVAAAYGRPLEGPDFVSQMLLVLATAVGLPRAREIFYLFGREKQLSQLADYFPEEERSSFLVDVPKKMAVMYGGVSIIRKIPFVCLPVNISLDYSLVSSAGLSAKYFFNDMRYSREELDALALETYTKQKAVLRLMLHMARADGNFDSAERQVVRELKSLLVVPPAERETLDRELATAPDVEALAGLFSQDDRVLLMRNILRVMLADLVKSPEEQVCLSRLKDVLHVSDDTVRRLEAEVHEELRAAMVAVGSAGP